MRLAKIVKLQPEVIDLEDDVVRAFLSPDRSCGGGTGERKAAVSESALCDIRVGASWGARRG